MIAPFFRCRSRHGAPPAEPYLQGLLSQMPRQNMERMGELLPDTRHEDLQHFLSDSPWDTGPVWRWVGQRASAHLGGRADSMLRIDESGFAKKGDRSVGVARQYHGRLGKTDNCQVGVFAVLALGPRATLVGARLFLPDGWVEDPARCRRAGVPEPEIRARTKLEWARALVAEAQAHGLQFQWVGADTFYGRDQGWLCELAGQGLGFLVDVPCDTRVWTQAPPSGARPAVLDASGAERVDAVGRQWSRGGKGQQVTLRVGENGPVAVRLWAQRVWGWPPAEPRPRRWWLLVREDARGERKFSLSNAPAQTSLRRLGRLQGQRHFIERTLEDGKSQVGMGQHQARKWRAWQHHMALVGLALLFVLEERLGRQEPQPLLSVRDVVERLDWYFRGSRSAREVEAAVRRRHQRRARLAAAALARAKKRDRKAQVKIPK